MSGSAAGLRATVRGSAGTAGAAVVVVLVAVLVVGMLSACSANPGTPGSLPTTTTPIGTASASRMPSTEPGDDEAQIEAAVRAYFDAVNVAVSGRGSEALIAASTSDCPCLRLVRTIEKLHAHGSIEGAAWTVRSLSVGPASGSRAVSTVRYSTAPYRTLDQSGRTIDSFPGYDIETTVTTIRSHNDWTVANFATISRVRT